MCNSDLINFSKAKKKAQLGIKHQIGPFICNTREVGDATKRILENYLRLQESIGWAPYDPHGFICDRRMKNRLSPYMHHRIPEIEQFSNMDEWREGTLVDTDNEQVNIENVMRDLERTLDLDSFGHVHYDNSEKLTSGINASAVGTSERHSQHTNTPATGTSKGKVTETSTQATKQSIMSKQPETSKE